VVERSGTAGFPLQSFQCVSSASDGPLPFRRASFPGVDLSFRVFQVRASTLIGQVLPSCARYALQGLRARPSPESFRIQVHPLVELAPLRSLSDDPTARFAGPRPDPRGSAVPVVRWRPLRPGLTLLRFFLPSALPYPGAPCGGVTSPTGSVFRFSQPLDGLSCPGSSRPCFMPLTLLGFALQSFPLPGIRAPHGVDAPLRLGIPPFLQLPFPGSRFGRSPVVAPGLVPLERGLFV